jgi:hypothetical protein
MWHRLFGLILTDFFTDSPVVVEIERDLSQQQHFLDVLIVRRHGGEFPERLPDGLEDLAEHNLITFKSLHEPLHDFALKELAAHSVAYRKLVSQSPSDLLPEDRFKLHAVCARVQQNLTGRIPWQRRLPGVYDCTWATDLVRVIVTGELPLEEHNAPLHLFSASAQSIEFGQRSYRRHSPQTSNLIGRLFESLRREGFAMSYTMEDFKRDYAKNNFPGLTAEELKDIVRDLKPHELKTFMQVLPLESMVAELPPEARVAGLPPEARMAGLSDEQIRQYLEDRSANRKETKRKPKRKK